MKHIFFLLLLFSTVTTPASMYPQEDITQINPVLPQAPEVVDLEIQQVKVTKDTPLWHTVSVTAKVTSIQKSESGISLGQILQLVYQVPAPEEMPSGYFGPGIPQPGAQVVAHLESRDKNGSFKPKSLEPKL